MLLANGEGIEKNHEEDRRLVMMMSGRVDGQCDVDPLPLARPNEIFNF